MQSMQSMQTMQTMKVLIELKDFCFLVCSSRKLLYGIIKLQNDLGMEDQIDLRLDDLRFWIELKGLTILDLFNCRSKS